MELCNRLCTKSSCISILRYVCSMQEFSPSSRVVHKLSLKLRMSDMPATAALDSAPHTHRHTHIASSHTLLAIPSNCVSKQTQMASTCMSMRKNAPGRCLQTNQGYFSERNQHKQEMLIYTAN